MRPTVRPLDVQAEAESAALEQVRQWRHKQGWTVRQAAEAIGSRAKDWDGVTIDAMRAFRALFDRQDAMIAALEQETATWQR